MEITAGAIRELIREGGIELPVDRLSDDGELRAQGADSLTMMDIFLVVEQHFGIKIPDEHVRGLKTLNDIASYVRRAKGTTP